ncbi:hypothetical protein XELAEV_18003994mg [Xenopus laevis]|uniref:C3H1-type domain-containing protein n=1 Tax=Xenopus laevis TaxID=8355 RepID=A0A974BS31_XENLA|nr:hypothetical protein XELAEV_18003994mg [Xenopus laevis]
MLSRFASAASARELSQDELLRWINSEKGRGAILEAFNQHQRQEVNVDACPSEESEDPAETTLLPQPALNPPTSAASASLRATTRGKKRKPPPKSRRNVGAQAKRQATPTAVPARTTEATPALPSSAHSSHWPDPPHPPAIGQLQAPAHLSALNSPWAISVPAQGEGSSTAPQEPCTSRAVTLSEAARAAPARSTPPAPTCAPQLHLPANSAPQPTSTSIQSESHVLQDLGKLDDILPGLKDLIQKHLVACSPGAATRQIGTGVSESCFRDAFSCEVTPIGLHLSSAVRDKIVRGDYIDLLSLLPSSKEFLKNDKRGDNEEDRRRPVARTFSNWLQAFCIYANILTEKHPEIAPGLFKHVDMILEAYKSYGGVAWFIYDDRFRQKMAINKMLKWGVKDIDLWMGMLLPKPQPPQFVNKTQTSQQRYNCCWAFNESICKFQTSCRFKHECAVCNGSHPAFRCLKRFLPNAGRGKEQHNKADNTSEVGKNGTIFKTVPKPAESTTHI